jgi:hypothetical protein
VRGPVVLATGLLLALAGFLTGCVAGGDRVELPTFPAVPGFHEPTYPLTQPTVLAYCPAMRAEHLVSFPAEPDAVYLCRAGEHRATDGTSTYGPWETVYRVADPVALLRRYSVPDATRSTGPCPQYLADPLILWVHVDGTVVAVYAPVDECGFPQEAAAAAYQIADREFVVEVDTGGPVDTHDTPAEH